VASFFLNPLNKSFMKPLKIFFAIVVLTLVSCQKNEVVKVDEKPIPLFSLCEDCAGGNCDAKGNPVTPCPGWMCCNQNPNATCFIRDCPAVTVELHEYITENAPVELTVKRLGETDFSTKTFTGVDVIYDQSGAVTSVVYYAE
jgi:hypothetical protein